MPLRVLCRADANATIATGHVMRCLALAQAIRDVGGEVIFVSKELPPSLQKRLEEENVNVRTLSTTAYGDEDAMETARIAQETGTNWVVLDGYDFKDSYQAVLKQAGVRILAIDDDEHCAHLHADIVLNQNIGAESMRYQGRGEHTQLLLGNRFTMLRRDVRQWSSWQRSIPKTAGHILVMMGGADPPNATATIVRAIGQMEALPKTTVLVGAANPHVPLLEQLLSCQSQDISLVTDVRDMPSLLSTADIAISASGSTAYECAFLGLPTLFLILAKNQENIAIGMEKAGAGINLGWIETLDRVKLCSALQDLIGNDAARTDMARNSRALIDGDGSDRIVMHLSGARIRMRQVREEDKKTLWHWANDPGTRQASFSSDPIAWETHIEWFDRKKQETDTFIFIGVDGEDTPVGYVRFEKRDGLPVLSIAVAPEKRGQGFSKELLQQGATRFFALSQQETVHAFVKQENATSIALFRSAGFAEQEAKEADGQLALHFTRNRDTMHL